ncbi:hypothetical protein EXE59_09775 [Nocardioides eburneiflavus]|uniref:Uncharacterized protein n=1 Tax=Nocardioides eburneiflavus TaxID=2518372 RepID=A0A4Z1CG74_9ACTN|nr:hypothetical protein [Nocardioides eburneiflavus]TGN64207.1 hypothetical protein EXE59_09775 [Nocardioides eburneiflavus]
MTLTAGEMLCWPLAEDAARLVAECDSATDALARRGTVLDSMAMQWVDDHGCDLSVTDAAHALAHALFNTDYQRGVL